MEAWLCSDPVRQLPLHEVESQQYPKGRELQRLLLQAHIQLRGIGDVGPALAVQHAGQPALHTLRRVHTRLLKTIFGPIPIARRGYSRRGAASIYPLDRDLQLSGPLLFLRTPETLRFGRRAGALPESIERIAGFSGVSIPKRSLEQILPDAAQDFYAQRSLPTATTSILVAAVDAMKPEGAKRTPRRSKGQKTNRKRMATVATVFTKAPWVRTLEEVVESLFRHGPAPATIRPTIQPPPPHGEQAAGLGQFGQRQGGRHCRSRPRNAPT